MRLFDEMQQFSHRARTPSPQPMQWQPRGFRNIDFHKACKDIDCVSDSEVPTPRGQYSREDCGFVAPSTMEAQREVLDNNNINQPMAMEQQSRPQETDEIVKQTKLCLSDMLAYEVLPEPPCSRATQDGELEVVAPTAPKPELLLAPLFGSVQRLPAQPRQISLVQCFNQDLPKQEKPWTQPVTHMVSIGSVGHPVTCSEACKYVGKARGCKEGASCDRCHLCKWNRYAPRKSQQKHA